MTRIAIATAFILIFTVGAEASEEAYEANVRGIDRRNLDLTVDPCDDFYQFANGNWMANNPIPAEYSSWGLFNELRDRNLETIRAILEDAAASETEPGTNEQKVGDFWAAAMDVEKINEKGLAPLAKDLARIEAIESTDDALDIVFAFQAEDITPLFNVGIDQDFKDTERYLVYAFQGGLGLPDRDYYTREGDEAEKLRRDYREHVASMLRHVGWDDDRAAAGADAVMALETRLAEASLTNVELRNPENYYHLMKVADADAKHERFSWARFFDRFGLEGLTEFSYSQPDFFAEMEKVLADTPVETWKAYLSWNLINHLAPHLDEETVAKDFAFYGTTLQGTEENQPRWKRVVAQANNAIGEALGQIYVAEAFPPETKARADAMIEDLRATVRERLQALPWMGDETKKKALEKLAAFVSKIGYPDRWRDYSALSISRDDYLGNIRAANAFEVQRNVDKIGKPIDRTEWGMVPQTVNAYYNPPMTEIVFPAAIMQPPFFDGEIDDAVNYGAMGGVIGHEFMHGFDDEGSKFAADGTLTDWWTAEDRERFEERAAKLVAHYDSFVAIDDLHVNGKLTLGENIGDLAGTTMAYHALQRALGDAPREKIDGFTPEQRFFLSWAQGWRNNMRPEYLKLLVNTNPHSPPKFRVNGPFAHMPEFAEAWGCEEGDPMVLPEEKRAAIW